MYSDNGNGYPVETAERSGDLWFWIHSALAIGSALALACPWIWVRVPAAVSVVVNTMLMLRETRWQ